MKKSFKGFTLIECIVALAILAIASLTMAQIYASVSLRNKNNHLINTSLSNQMAYVEKYTDSEAIPIYFNENGSGTSIPDPQTQTGGAGQPPHKAGGGVSLQDNYVKIVRVIESDSNADGINDTRTLSDDDVYSFPVDTFVLMSRDNNDKNTKDASFGAQYGDLFDADGTGDDPEDSYNLRYKYILGHSN